MRMGRWSFCWSSSASSFFTSPRVFFFAGLSSASRLFAAFAKREPNDARNAGKATAASPCPSMIALATPPAPSDPIMVNCSNCSHSLARFLVSSFGGIIAATVWKNSPRIWSWLFSSHGEKRQTSMCAGWSCSRNFTIRSKSHVFPHPQGPKTAVTTLRSFGIRTIASASVRANDSRPRLSGELLANSN